MAVLTFSTMYCTVVLVILSDMFSLFKALKVHFFNTERPLGGEEALVISELEIFPDLVS